MALAPDMVGSFDVDVSRVDESSYAFLRAVKPACGPR
jgi:hypothetical protein